MRKLSQRENKLPRKHKYFPILYNILSSFKPINFINKFVFSPESVHKFHCLKIVFFFVFNFPGNLRKFHPNSRQY